MSGATRADLNAQCTAAVNSMVAHLRTKYRSCADFDASQHDFTAFSQLVTQQLHQQLDSARFADGRVFSFFGLHTA